MACVDLSMSSELLETGRKDLLSAPRVAEDRVRWQEARLRQWHEKAGGGPLIARALQWSTNAESELARAEKMRAEAHRAVLD